MSAIRTLIPVSLLLLLASVLGACGGGAASSSGASSTSSEIADGKHLTTFQKSRLVGHYSTEDGNSGFILDRTGDPAKAKLDGDPTAKVLSASGGYDHSTELRSDDHRIWIRITSEGTVELFQGPKQHQGERVVRDADAEQLK